MNFEKKLYSISQAAELIGVSADTLRRWEEEGLYQPVRTSGGQRRYDVSSLKKLRPLTRRFRGRKNLPSKDEVQFLIPAVSPATSSDAFHRPIYLNRKYLTLASVVMVWFIAFGFAFGRTEVGKKFFGETGSILKSLFNSEEAMRRIA
ncbi:MAG: MerR family DNA-binding transcriptional regulator, partial [Patescibacteria group bacterium]